METSLSLQQDNTPTSIFSFRGRTARAPYAVAVLAWIVVATVLNVSAGTVRDPIAAGIVLLIWVVGFYLFLAISARRARDAGDSPWFVLTLFIPLVGLIAMLYLIFKKGVNDENLS